MSGSAFELEFTIHPDRQQNYGVGGGGGYGEGLRRGRTSTTGIDLADRLRDESEGWPSMDSYKDLSLNVWKIVPLQLTEAFYDIKFSARENKEGIEDKVRSEIAAEGGTPIPGNENSFDKSIATINKLIKKRQGALEDNQYILSTLPPRKYTSISIEEIMNEIDLATRSDDDAFKEILDQMIDGLTADLNIELHSLAIEALEKKLAEAIKEKAKITTVPPAPVGVLIDENLKEAKERYKFFNGANAFLLGWFYTKVKNKGDWDYKQRGSQYQEFGNFNYGATGEAAGISTEILLRAAGAAQSVAGTSSEEFGKWWESAPYGDDPMDQEWIKAGIEYAKSKGY